MTLRSDHVAGAVFIIFGLVVFALSGDLPFGRLSAPGAGMLPKLLIILMVVFSVVLMADAAAGQPFAEIDWSGGGHALKVVLIAGAAAAAYQPLGFLLTMSLLVFALLVIVERQPLHYSAGYAIMLTLCAYWLFGKALKAPLQQGILGF